MKPAIAKLWASALESGAYEKGPRGMLTAQHTWCSLGVLCDVMMNAIPSLGTKWRWNNQPTIDFPKVIPLVPVVGTHHWVSPPLDFITEAHFNHATPQFPGGLYVDSVNDAGMSFANQATIIRRYMHQL